MMEYLSSHGYSKITFFKNYALGLLLHILLVGLFQFQVEVIRIHVFCNS